MHPGSQGAHRNRCHVAGAVPGQCGQVRDALAYNPHYKALKRLRCAGCLHERESIALKGAAQRPWSVAVSLMVSQRPLASEHAAVSSSMTQVESMLLYAWLAVLAVYPRVDTMSFTLLLQKLLAQHLG